MLRIFWVGIMILLELKAANQKIDMWRCHGKLYNKVAASGANVLATDARSEQVDFMCSIGLNTHVIDSKKWVFKCEFKIFFFKIALSWVKDTDLINICVSRLFQNGRFHASLQ
jgi:hypothetical protein